MTILAKLVHNLSVYTFTKNHEGLAGTTAAINYLADLGFEFGVPLPSSA